MQLISESTRKQINVPGFENLEPYYFAKAHHLFGRD
jgi:hypothetical protein